MDNCEDSDWRGPAGDEIDEAEVSRDVPGYEGLYEVNLLGQVWSVKRKKFIKPSLALDRPLVYLSKSGKQQYRDIAYIMVKAFFPTSTNYETVDGNPFNLHWDNLMAAHE